MGAGLASPRLRNLICVVICLSGFALGRQARAEEELRIALLSRAPAVKVGGEGLAIYDGARGALLAQFEGDVTLTLAPSSKGIEAKGRAGVDLKGATRVFVEADHAVRVDDGVYFGRIEVGPDPRVKRRFLVVNRLPLETYLLGIVGSEMNPTWPLEALKAQAVAARTYAMQRRAMMRAAARPYDLASTVISQVYKGAERIRPAVEQAVKETRGEVMSFEHDLVEALFHSTCGGGTVSAKQAFGGTVEYLTPVPCDWCRASNRYRWKLSFSLGELTRRLSAAGIAKGTVRKLERGARDAQVLVVDARGSRRVAPRTIRKALGFGKLFSERFTVRTRAKRADFDGRGFGHGVGLCQWGAYGQAGEGRTYRQILAHYYPKTRIRRLY